LKNKHNYNKLKPPNFLKTQKMKKLLALVLITTLFSACGLISETEKPAEEKNEIKEESTNEIADNFLDDQIFSSAVGTFNKERCGEIINNQRKTECIQVIEDTLKSREAYDKLDKSMCEAVENERYKENCITTIEMELKRIEEDNLKIQKLEEEQNKVGEILGEAISTKDLKKCEEIKDEGQKYSCRYSIISQKASEANDATICDEIGSPNFIELCKSAFQTL